MMLKEFEERANIFPDANLYEAIEEAYNDYPGNKDQFCKAYKANTDGLAEKIQRAATLKAVNEKIAQKKQAEELAAEIEKLKAQLEREQEWKPYTDASNVQQQAYDELKEASGTKRLSDEEAKDLLYDWYGFAREKVTIHHTIDAFEVNRHRQLRKVGKIERLPLYNATDWNYIRFDCGCMTYELENDNLRPFVH